MYPASLPLSEKLREQHALAWRTIASPGDFFSGEERVEMVRTARDALECRYCADRKSALSPSAVRGQHDSGSFLDDVVVDMIHRIRTDPGRLTHSWFQDVTQTVSQPEYVEIVSVVTSSVIIDTLHNALGLGRPVVAEPQDGEPRRQFNTDTVDEGAWLPMLAAPRDMSDTGLPQVPNIARALGLVPSALDLFFTTFRPHYALKDIELSISQAQAEFVAARVSALNECFY